MTQPDEGLVHEPELVERARRSDAAAWEELMRRHQEPVFRLAYLLLGDADEAEDAAQETFIRAYRSLARFDAARPLRPWLFSIAANLSRNRRRSLGRYLSALGRLVHAQSPAQRSVEDGSLEQLQAAALWQAVQRLNPAGQQVIYMRFFLQMPVEEVAQATGVAEGTVKSRLHRALQQLRAVIERDFPGLKDDAFASARPLEGLEE